jgi:threonine dehydrogenase-like Zn-dependent dehydrogenase
MKTWRFHAPGDWRLDEVPVPKARRGEILVRIRVVQPSVSEVAIAQGGSTINAERFTRLVQERAPVQALGHEFSGEVAACGPGVTRYNIGDRVACYNPVVPCGRCRFCKSDRGYACAEGPMLGYELPGCFAEYVTMPESCVVPIPKKVSFQAGACVQSLDSAMACALMAKEKMRGGVVVVLGQGVLGLPLTQMARHLDARRVIATARREESLRLAKRLGAKTAINVEQEDAVQRVMALTKGAGADVVFECAGGPEAFGLAGQRTLHEALAMVAREGLIVQPAIVVGEARLDLGHLRNNRLSITWPRALTLGEARLLVRWMAQRAVQVEPTITHAVRGLERAPEAFQITRDRRKLGGINPCQIILA